MSLLEPVPLLEVEGLTKRFGGITAVDGLTFTVAEGEWVGLIGPNGRCFLGIRMVSLGR